MQVIDGNNGNSLFGAKTAVTTPPREAKNIIGRWNDDMWEERFYIELKILTLLSEELYNECYQIIESESWCVYVHLLL